MDKADDLVQDTLLKAWTNSEKFAEGTELYAWLFTILRNCFYSEYRKRRREVEDGDDLFAAQLVAEPRQDAHMDLLDFQEAFRQLAPEQREALVLVGAEGMAYEEVAAICSCPVGTVKSRVNRARARLAQLLSLEDAEGLAAAPPALPAGVKGTSREFATERWPVSPPAWAFARAAAAACPGAAAQRSF